MRKLALIIVLVIVIIVSASYSVHRLMSEKADLAIQFAELFEDIALPYHMLRLAAMERDTTLRVPLIGVDPIDIADTWNEPRSGGRVHQGVDMFAARGTPVFSATEGFVIRKGYGGLGGNFVFVIGKGGARYYYAHLDAVALGIDYGTKVTTDTVLGFVGDTGNASGTPPHLHFGMYANGPQNPYPLLVPR